MVDADLAEIYRALQAEATQRGFELFPGGLPTGHEGGTFPVAKWQGGWRGFLDLAAKLGVRLVYLRQTEFDYDANVALAAGYVSNAEARSSWSDTLEEELDLASPWLHERLIDRTRQWQPHNSEICAVECWWFIEGVGHRLELQADWLVDFQNAVFEERDEAKRVEIENQRLLSDDDARRLYQLAEEMAHHERFAEASSEAKRTFMAGQLFPDEEAYAQSRIAELANLIYWWQVEPAECASKAERARQLHAKGIRPRHIGAMLKMSEEKVLRAIGDRDLA